MVACAIPTLVCGQARQAPWRAASELLECRCGPAAPAAAVALLEASLPLQRRVCLPAAGRLIVPCTAVSQPAAGAPLPGGRPRQLPARAPQPSPTDLPPAAAHQPAGGADEEEVWTAGMPWLLRRPRMVLLLFFSAYVAFRSGNSTAGITTVFFALVWAFGP